MLICIIGLVLFVGFVRIRVVSCLVLVICVVCNGLGFLLISCVCSRGYVGL